MAAASGYDAFISYSHQHDGVLGPRLQSALQRFAKPWYRKRALRIFRDTADLSASPALWASIEEALRESRWFVLLASQEAARSVWVNREVQWWLDHQSANRLIIIGTEAGLAWDEHSGDWAAGAPVPPALRRAFSNQPLWVDLSDIPLGTPKARIPADRIATVAAPIRGMSKDMLVGEHLRQHRRVMRLAAATIAFLVALAVALTAVTALAVHASREAVHASREADDQRDIAVSRLLYIQSEALGEADPTLSRLQSLAAWRIYPSDAARHAMLIAAALPGTATLVPSSLDIDEAVFSPDGKILASVGGTGQVKLWNPATHQQIGDKALNVAVGRSFQSFNPAAFSPDGKLLAVVNTYGGVQLWHMVTRQPPGKTISSGVTGVNAFAFLPEDQIDSVAFSPDSKILASAGYDGAIRLWDVATRRQIGSQVNASAVSVNSLAFSPDGRILASADNDGFVRLWDVATGQQIGSTLNTGIGNDHNPTNIGVVVFSPDGEILASVTGDGTVRLWDVATGQQIGNQINASAGLINSLAFSPNGAFLASAGNDGSIRLWDVATKQQVGSPISGSDGPVYWVAFSPDGKTLASANYDGTMRLWNAGDLLPTATLTARKARSGPVGSVAFSPDGRTLAVGNRFGATLWDMATHRYITNLPNKGAGPVCTVMFSPNGKILASANNDFTVQLWNMATRRQIESFSAACPNGSVAFSPDSKILAAGNTESGVQLWNLTNRAKAGYLSAGILNVSVQVVAFSPDGKILAGATGSGLVLWNVATRRRIGKPMPNAIVGGFASMAFSPDGQTVAVSSDDVIQLFNVTTRRQIGNPFASNQNPDDNVTSVAFSPDSQILAVGSDDGTVQLWDVATDQEVGPPLAGSGDPSDPVTSVAFSPDGQTLAVGTQDGLVQLWNVSYLTNVTQRLCAEAGRSFTRAEWAEYVQNLAYEKLCS